MTREEAFDKLRYWDFLNEEEKEVLRTLIPEYMEFNPVCSDEKKRDWMIRLINVGNYREDPDYPMPCTRSEMIKYLESLESLDEPLCPIEECECGLEIAADILRRTRGKVQGYQTDDGIRKHDTALAAVYAADEKNRWKPTNEQISCLNWVSECFLADGPVDRVIKKRLRGIIEGLEQLQK